MTARWVIRDAEVGGRHVDVVVNGGVIGELTGAGRGSGDVVVDAGGGALLPGLHDHHVHLMAMAAARASVVCGPPGVGDRRAFVDVLHRADAALPAGAWIRGVGYHETVAGDLDRRLLDAIVAERPCRVQHRSGHGWAFNSAALRAAGIDGGDLPEGVERDVDGLPTGRIFGLDDWLRARLPHTALDLAAVGAELAAYGITAVTDATPFAAAEALAPLAAAVRTGAIAQCVVVTGGPSLPDSDTAGLERGVVKLVVADHLLPPLERFVADLRGARRLGRQVAVHCVTREALVLALAGWDEVGAEPGDRIEHGAVIPLELATTIAELGLTVVTQPAFVADRGDDYLREVDPADCADLWRCGSLVAAGIPVGFGTDAPFGPADPWRVIAAAVDRRTPSGVVLGSGERLAAGDALGRFLTPLDHPGAAARRVTAGAPADLCLLAVPLAEALAAPDSGAVRLVTAAGQVIHGG